MGANKVTKGDDIKMQKCLVEKLLYERNTGAIIRYDI